MELPPTWVFHTASVCIGILLAANAYFVKRLVDKIDKTDETVRRMEVKIGFIEGKLFKSRNVSKDT